MQKTAQTATVRATASSVVPARAQPSEFLTFTLGEEEYGVIILNVADRVVGMVVDGVSDVLTLQPEQIRAAPEFGGGLDTNYIIGLGVVDTRMLILMDIERLMTSQGMALIDMSVQ